MGRLVGRSARPAARTQVPRPGTQMPTMAPGTAGLATVWSSACWSWRWIAGENADGVAAVACRAPWSAARVCTAPGSMVTRATTQTRPNERSVMIYLLHTCTGNGDDSTWLRQRGDGATGIWP